MAVSPFWQHAAVTDTRDQRPAEATLDFLRSVFPPEWREPALGHEAVAEWEQENGVVLPEPYRTFIAEVSNGSSLGPAGDGGLQPLGWLPDTWPDPGPRQPGEPFPWRQLGFGRTMTVSDSRTRGSTPRSTRGPLFSGPRTGSRSGSC